MLKNYTENIGFSSQKYKICNEKNSSYKKIVIHGCKIIFKKLNKHTILHHQ